MTSMNPSVQSGHGSVGSDAQPARPRASIEIVRGREEARIGESAMAALVAYYLSELAQASSGRTPSRAESRKDLFRQAGFRLPKSPRQTLPNAQAAGYFATSWEVASFD